jgi:hypothetical protein
MSETFVKQVKFLSHSFDGEKPVDVILTKDATFKELNRTDKSQHDLHFDIVGLLVKNKVSDDDDDESNKVLSLDMAKVGALVKKAIKTTALTDNNFTETDKKEFLQDFGALLPFSNWYMQEKVLPFFQSLSMT